MKESIHTIPLMDAFRANDECPFCFLEREAEQHAISFTLGSGASYMEADVREETDRVGFCRHHYKMMLDYGNRQGASLILSTHLKALNKELSAEIAAFKSGKTTLKKRLTKTQVEKNPAETTLGQWVNSKLDTCYVCDHYMANYNRYLDTFFDLYKGSPEFVEMFKNSRAFCLPHFRDLVETAERKLSDKQKADFYPVLFDLMQRNYQSLNEDVLEFCDLYDYQKRVEINKKYEKMSTEEANERKKLTNTSAERAMQKLAGGYPADEPFKMKL